MCLTRIPKPKVARAAIVSPETTLGLGNWPNALYPADIVAAYGWQSSDHSTGTGETIALVDAYDDPTIESNLGTFSTQFGLPSCTSADGCFTKVNQTGGTTYPAQTKGWDTEISLDVEWAHAMAPKAKILLVEATTSSYANLFTAVSYAATHAQYVSMSWGGTESSSETSYDSTFTAHADTVSFFAASGDKAATVEYPSSSPDVVSVGGTKLDVTQTTKTIWKGESGWSTGGGGCSTVEAATTAQADFPTYSQPGVTCGGHRGTPDVAADASPTTGVAIYDTVPTPKSGYAGWLQIGGTSLATPLWAAHSAADGVHVTATYVYGRNLPFYDITTGGNGRDCLSGYNLCDGLGSWSTSHGSLNTVAPSAPANLHETGQTSTSVSLAWTTPASTGGTAVDHYIVLKTGIHFATLGTTRTYTVTGLANDTAYHFTVKAENSVASSPASNTLAVTTTATPRSQVGFTAPGTGAGYVIVGTLAAPSNVAFSSTYVHWTEATADPGSITYYAYAAKYVRQRPTKRTTPFEVCATTERGSGAFGCSALTSVQQTSLRSSTKYEFEVVASTSSSSPADGLHAASTWSSPVFG